MTKIEMKVLDAAERILAEVQHEEPNVSQIVRTKIREYFSSFERGRIIAIHRAETEQAGGGGGQ